MIYDYHQDDPRKCTSAKLQKLHLAKPIYNLNRISPQTIVLNPSSNQTLSHQDRPLIKRHGIIALDCSWNLAETILQTRIRGANRRLPMLIAGNPTNYSARGKLSTAEALAAAMIITGFEREARKILEVFTWGDTFLSLNKDPLREYLQTPPERIPEVERDYFATD